MMTSKPLKWSGKGLEGLARNINEGTIGIVEGQLMSQIQVDDYLDDQVKAFRFAARILRREIN